MATEEGLVDLLNELNGRIALLEGPKVDVWANGLIGDDVNFDGLSEETPVKSLSKLASMLRYFVQVNVAAHLTGDLFEDVGQVYFDLQPAAGVKVVIEGENEVTVLDDNGGNDYTSDAAGINSIGVTGAFTPTPAPGSKFTQWLEMRTGDTAGQVRTVQKNTADLVTLHREFSQIPAVGDKFRFVRPKTEVRNASVVIQNRGAGTVYVQNLYFGATATANLIVQFSNPVKLSHLMNNSSNLNAYKFESCRFPELGDRLMDTETYTQNDSLLGKSCGVSQGNGGSFFGFYFLLNSVCRANACVGWAIINFKTQAVQIGNGSKSLFELLNGCPFNGLSTPNITTNAGYATTEIGGHPVYGAFGGIDMNNSDLCIGDGVDISGSTNGIRAIYSQLRMHEVTGSNTACGVLAQHLTSIQVRPTKTPTLSGNGGTVDVSVDGATEAVDWPTIIASGFTDATQLIRAGVIAVPGD